MSWGCVVKLKNGLLIAVLLGGLGIAMWAALTLFSGNDAPDVPEAVSGAPGVEGSTDRHEDAQSPAEAGPAEGSEDPAAIEAASDSSASGDIDAAAEPAPAGPSSEASSGDRRRSKAKLKDPRDKYCPPAAYYGDKPRKGCTGDY